MKKSFGVVCISLILCAALSETIGLVIAVGQRFIVFGKMLSKCCDFVVVLTRSRPRLLQTTGQLY